ncbi:MAG TPA: DUF2127 domain-containing protein [Candidatus Kapabacteria bacterium]|nr:DUF2127 domain-containing protein [Candidatus Kapabacteria bacterium]
MKFFVGIKEKKSFIDKAFHISLVLKGIDGALELIGGVLFLFLKPATIGTVTGFLTRHELAEDPKDFLANLLLHLAHNLSVSSELVASIYLLAHGVLKVILVVGLFTERRGFYLPALIFLGLFIAVELGRLIESFSIGISLLMLFDLFVIWMVWLEFQNINRTNHSAQSTYLK